MPNAYTFAIVDQNDLITASLENEIRKCAEYVISLASHYIDWKGTLDFVVNVRPASESPYPGIDGILPSVAQIGWNGSAWINETLTECLTGVDSDPSKPDAGCTIYLAADGTIKNYGAPVWFDPNPQFEVDPGLPAGKHDFVGIYTHEIFHSLGFYEVTQQWRNHIVTEGGISYFTGENAVALYGGRLPFAANSDHYGYSGDPAINLSRGLMYQFGNYERNRLDIGRIDLAVLADLGHNIKTYAGLSLFEMIDTDLTLTGTAAGEILYGDYHGNALYGRGGNDQVFAGSGNDTILGEDGNDALYGENGADNLDGGVGDDVLDGGAGADTMTGGLGSDVFIVDNAGDALIEAAGGGIDTVQSAVSFVLAAELEHLTLTGKAAIDGTGNGLNNVITGNAAGNDLGGGAGDDRLRGATGNDVMVGGTGADTFVFATLADSRDHVLRSDGKKFVPDVIADFTSGEDKIDLSAIDADAGTAPDDPFTFLGTGAFTGHAGELRYEVKAGQAHIYADVDGNGVADLHIMANAPAILASDFIL